VNQKTRKVVGAEPRAHREDARRLAALLKDVEHAATASNTRRRGEEEELKSNPPSIQSTLLAGHVGKLKRPRKRLQYGCRGTFIDIFGPEDRPELCQRARWSLLHGAGGCVLPIWHSLSLSPPLFSM
jgi:hypothetical protein